MARYVSPEIAQARDNPTVGAIRRVALVPTEDASGGSDRVEEFGGDVIRELPSGVLVAELPEEKLAPFCEADSLASVSSPSQMELFV